jgi:hypothetical protein
VLGVFSVNRFSRATSCAVLFLLTASLFSAMAPQAAAGGTVSVWRAPTSLETADNDTSVPRAAVASDGSAMVVWQQATNTTPYIAANLYVPGSGWSGATNISWGPTGTNPRVAALGNGRFLAAWVGTNNVSVNLYQPATGWSGPTQIVAPGSSISSISLAADASGRAGLAWVTNNFPNRVQASLYLTGLGWAAPTLFVSQNFANSVTIALSGQGGAVVAWRETTGAAARVSGSLYTSGWGWTASASLTGTYPAAYYNDMAPAAAMNASGSALVVTRMLLGTPYLAIPYAPGSGWGANTTLSPLMGGVAYTVPTLSTDGGGGAVVPFTEALPNGSYASELFWYNGSSSMWTDLLVPTTWLPAGNTAAAFDPDGRLLVAWAEDTGAGWTARAERYLPALGWTLGWQAPTEFTSALNASIGVSGRLSLDVGRNGDAALAWLDNSSGPVNMFGAVFERDTQVPSLLVTTTPPGASNQTSFTVAGTTDPLAQVSVDGVAVSVDGLGAFSTIVTLAEGPHIFVVVAWDQEGNRAEVRLPVWVDSTPPSLSLSAPPDGLATSSAAVVVSGMSEPGALVEVNGIPIPSQPTGSFAYAVALLEGANVITVTATDAAGNIASVARTVTFNNPLSSDLAAAQAQLAGALAQLNVTNASLASANAQLVAADASLSASQADLRTAQANLAAAVSNANTTQAQLASAQANVTAAQATYVSAQASLSAAQTQVAASQSDLATARAAYADASVRADNASAALTSSNERATAAQQAATQSRADAAAAQSQAAGAAGTATVALLVGLAALLLGVVAMARSRRRAPHEDEARGRSEERGRGKSE